VVLPDYPGLVASREFADRPRTTAEMYTSGEYPFLSPSRMDRDTAPLFALGAPKATRIMAELVQLTAPDTEFDDGRIVPQIVKVINTPVSMEV
jgi:hypothetical protein